MLTRIIHLGIASVVAVACSVIACQPCSAAIIYSFGTDQSNYDVGPGGMVDVEVYLYETVTGGDSSRLLDEDGLSQAQVTIERSGTVPSDPAILFDYIANTAEFDDLLSPLENDFTDSTLDVTQFVDIGAISGPTGEDLGGGVRRQWLLTLNVAAGSVVGEATTFQVFDNPVFDETLTFLGVDALDWNPGIASTEFTINTVPEPTTGTMFLALMGIGVLFFRRRRRRAG